ncbi:SDR family NAD(P)-dependent oxidoreductase [Microbulbifer pacificus]|uniref:SDR family NAD(P)-dependent oxidoreductase n=1 Tax=Microbulbifer pacificus TaxID=407164 RepID=A0AAU0MXQ2_9GAMM|nr:SDR family NAD(P)-dependent oxidoreductase [Microbulbifer pacificus]WOX04980.1 SDR family NAD(P)-dependent oxidoreductase [Microbulbifer pacificus]
MNQPDNSPPACILVAGASGGLGVALCRELIARFPRATLLTVSRGEVQLAPTQSHLKTNLSDPESVAATAQWLQSQPLPNWVINCCGTLHWDGHLPEKNLLQCTDEALLRSISVNVLSHLHLAQALSPQLRRQSPLTWASLSAKVGSIEDNGLGGWYSYRMSKAALNMLVRNLSIEWGRKLDSCRVVAVHPGTTDTALSKPFQKNIAVDKLYAPALSAERVVSVIAGLQDSDTGKLLFWDGTTIHW